jgi:hypothetical protein
MTPIKNDSTNREATRTARGSVTSLEGVLRVLDDAIIEFRERDLPVRLHEASAARAYLATLAEQAKPVDELVAAAKDYMEARGTTHGQRSRNRLRAALAAILATP